MNLNQVTLPARDVNACVSVYRGLGLRFRWTVGPDSRPADLAERLERRGLRRNETLVTTVAT